MKKYKVGIIGLGVGEKHLKKFKQIKGCEIISIYDKNIKKLKVISKKYKIRYCKNENEIFKDNQINLVSIASYDGDHYSHASRAILNNKNVFIEKPAFTSIKECLKIKKILKNRDIGIFSNLVLRTSDRFISLKKKIKKNFFGKIYFIEADYNYGRLEKIISGWRSKIKNYSVNIHLVCIIFLILFNLIIIKTNFFF